MLKPSKHGLNDKLYFLNLKFAWFFTVSCFILNALQGVLNITDLAIIHIGIPAVWGELGLHTGFYVWKCKAENMKKWNKEDNITM